MELPHNMKSRPKDRRGNPIPYQQARHPDGTPDFRSLDPSKTVECVRDKRCGLCGRRLKNDFAFIGGPLCAVNRLFLDTAMHYTCARYAMQACPHLARAKGRYAPIKPDERTTHHVNELASDQKADRFMIGRTTGFDFGLFQGEVFIKAEPWISLEWWRDGQQVEP